jgi:hypothetical protein
MDAVPNRLAANCTPVLPIKVVRPKQLQATMACWYNGLVQVDTLASLKCYELFKLVKLERLTYAKARCRACNKCAGNKVGNADVCQAGLQGAALLVSLSIVPGQNSSQQLWLADKTALCWTLNQQATSTA